MPFIGTPSRRSLSSHQINLPVSRSRLLTFLFRGVSVSVSHTRAQEEKAHMRGLRTISATPSADHEEAKR